MTDFRWTPGMVTGALRAAGLMAGSAAASQREIRAIVTDTRTLQRGDLFVALRGEHFDGHDFLSMAAERGASGVVVSTDAEAPTGLDVDVFRVTDTLGALGALAHHRRLALTAPVVVVTGSSGKTTTKELLRSALDGWTEVHASEGNLNNRIGLPRTLLDAPDSAGVVVAEAGTSERGEIATLAAIAAPDVAVVTTVGEAHLEGLGSLDGVLNEKLDLIRGMRTKGTAFVGEEPSDLPRRAGLLGRRVKTVGFGPDASPGARGEDLERDTEGCFRFRWNGHAVRVGVPGRHVALDALIALAVADHLGAPLGGAADAVAEYRGGGLRDEVRRIGPLTVVVDCYNANPQSTRAALSALVDRPSQGPRIAVLGSMLEMGERERKGHREVLDFAAGLPLDLLVLTGAFAEAAPAVDAPYERVVALDPQDAYERLRDRLAPDAPATVLLKGSRGVSLERLLPSFERDFGGGGD